MPTMGGETARQIDIVNVDDDRDVALARELRHQLHDLDRGLRIEGRGRLVGQEDVGLLHDRPADADPLPLAAGERIGAPRRETGKPDGIEELERPLDVAAREAPEPRPPSRHVAEPAAEQVLHDGHALDEVVLLEHHPDAPPCLAQRQTGELGESWPRKRISPAVGSTRRLMQRISVDLPVPDGPMTAVMPRPGMARSMSFSTGTPGRYSLRSLRMRSARASPSLVAATTAGAAVIASSVPRPSCAPPRPRGPPLSRRPPCCRAFRNPRPPCARSPNPSDRRSARSGRRR